jgi:NADP-dependent 3-hydroxy acid dehydrogenase YdfG
VAAHEADVTEPDAAAELVQAAVAAFGGIDILINNVGGGGGPRIADSTDDNWPNTREANLIQTVQMMRLTLPNMTVRADAAVINGTARPRRR